MHGSWNFTKKDLYLIPNDPRVPKSPTNLMSNMVVEVTKEHPELKEISEIGKRAAEKLKNLSEEERKVRFSRAL